MKFQIDMIQSWDKLACPGGAGNTARALATTHRIGGAGVMVDVYSTIPNDIAVAPEYQPQRVGRGWLVICWNCQKPFVTKKIPKPTYFHACSPTCKQQGHQKRIFDRLWKHVIQEGDCWVWQGACHRQGYGIISANNRCIYVYKLVYKLTRGPIPTGKVLDHLCRNPPCCSPAHLEVVTPGINVLRGMAPSALNAQKTHCLRGHPFDEKNTILRPDSKRRKGGRQCRTCTNESRLRRWHAAKD